MFFAFKIWTECCAFRVFYNFWKVFFFFVFFFPIPLWACVIIKAPYLRVISFLISPNASLFAIASSSVNGSAKVMASTKPTKAARIRPFISETCLLLVDEKFQIIHLLYTFELRRGRDMLHWKCVRIYIRILTYHVNVVSYDTSRLYWFVETKNSLM